ncbi:MAG: hypothetical protein WC641_02055 [Patescibacteria group bacterium]
MEKTSDRESAAGEDRPREPLPSVQFDEDETPTKPDCPSSKPPKKDPALHEDDRTYRRVDPDWIKEHEGKS